MSLSLERPMNGVDYSADVETRRLVADSQSWVRDLMDMHHRAPLAATTPPIPTSTNTMMLQLEEQSPAPALESAPLPPVQQQQILPTSVVHLTKDGADDTLANVVDDDCASGMGGPWQHHLQQQQESEEHHYPECTPPPYAAASTHMSLPILASY